MEHGGNLKGNRYWRDPFLNFHDYGRKGTSQDLPGKLLFIVSWWLNQPIWTRYARQIGSSPQKTGETSQNIFEATTLSLIWYGDQNLMIQWSFFAIRENHLGPSKISRSKQIENHVMKHIGFEKDEKISTAIILHRGNCQVYSIGFLTVL